MAWQGATWSTSHTPATTHQQNNGGDWRHQREVGWRQQFDPGVLFAWVTVTTYVAP